MLLTFIVGKMEVSLCDLTKQFKTEKETNKYVEKLIKKGFKIDFSVEHITS